MMRFCMLQERNGKPPLTAVDWYIAGSLLNTGKPKQEAEKKRVLCVGSGGSCKSTSGKDEEAVANEFHGTPHFAATAASG